VARVNLFSVFFHPTGYSITVFFIPPYSFLAAGLLLSSCWLAVFPAVDSNNAATKPLYSSQLLRTEQAFRPIPAFSVAGEGLKKYLPVPRVRHWIILWYGPYICVSCQLRLPNNQMVLCYGII